MKTKYAKGVLIANLTKRQSHKSDVETFNEERQHSPGMQANASNIMTREVGCMIDLVSFR